MKQETTRWEATDTPGLYVRQPGGGFYARITLNGKRSWRHKLQFLGSCLLRRRHIDLNDSWWRTQIQHTISSRFKQLFGNSPQLEHLHQRLFNQIVRA